jgi:ferredoxin
MRAGSDAIETVRAALAPHGLFVRGIVSGQYHPSLMPETGIEPDIGCILLIGTKGGSNWPSFRSWQGGQPDCGGLHPLDQWSKAVINPIAAAVHARVWFPSDPPFQPFQQWAKAAEGLKPSPLGILIHPDYGLWHSYRAALGFGFDAALDPVTPPVHPCDTCVLKPCMTVCPTKAINSSGFDLLPCRQHLSTEAGRTGCRQSGCFSRNACPVGADWRYSADQIQFHMAALG